MSTEITRYRQGPLDCLLEPQRDPKEQTYRRFAASVWPSDRLSEGAVNLQDDYFRLLPDEEVKQYLSQFDLPYESRDDIRTLTIALCDELEKREKQPGGITLELFLSSGNLPEVPQYSGVQEEPLDELYKLVEPLERTLKQLYKWFKKEEDLGEQTMELGDCKIVIIPESYRKPAFFGTKEAKKIKISVEPLHYFKQHRRDKMTVHYYNPLVEISFYKRFLREPISEIVIGLPYIYSTNTCFSFDFSWGSSNSFISRLKRKIELKASGEITENQNADCEWLIKNYTIALNIMLTLPCLILKARETGNVRFPDMEEAEKKREAEQRTLEVRKRLVPELMFDISQATEDRKLLP